MIETFLMLAIGMMLAFPLGMAWERRKWSRRNDFTIERIVINGSKEDPIHGPAHARKLGREKMNRLRKAALDPKF